MGPDNGIFHSLSLMGRPTFSWHLYAYIQASHCLQGHGSSTRKPITLSSKRSRKIYWLKKNPNQNQHVRKEREKKERNEEREREDGGIERGERERGREERRKKGRIKEKLRGRKN